MEPDGFDPENPLPPIETSPIRLGLEVVATLPPSAPGAPTARVQQVEPVPGLDGALAAVDTRGVIWLIEHGTVRETPLLDLRAGAVGFREDGGEAGLRSMAFHPDFGSPGTPGFGKVYVGFSADPASPAGVPRFSTERAVAFDDVVAELTVADPADPVAAPSELRELFRLAQPFSNHNLGNLGFEPGLDRTDPGYGLLHIAVGDGGSGGDPLGLAADLTSPFGKLLRIDPLGREPGLPYAIPPDNPLLARNDLPSGFRPEILAFGFRNPQTWSFDEGRIWLGDIGQNSVEEIDILAVGGDHGWNGFEGSFRFAGGGIAPLQPGDDAPGRHFPITQYDHEEITSGGEAVAGGFVYHGAEVAALQSLYLFSNFPDGRLFALSTAGLDAVLADGRVSAAETRAPLEIGLLDDDGAETDFAEIVGRGRVDLRFGRDHDGELLVFAKANGTIYRLTDPPGLGQGISEAEATAVAALYETALDRDGSIDAAGLNFWIDAREDGLSAPGLARAFLRAPEFERAFGDAESLDDESFVQLLFRNVLEREGDDAGVAFWTGTLDRPGFDRADLLFAFAVSAENTGELESLERLAEVAPGVWDFTG